MAFWTGQNELEQLAQRLFTEFYGVFFGRAMSDGQRKQNQTTHPSHTAAVLLTFQQLWCQMKVS